MLQSDDLAEQYSDLLVILLRRFQKLQSILGRTAPPNQQTALSERAFAFAAVSARVASLRGYLPHVEVVAAELPAVPDWYLNREECADRASPWRLAAAIERLGSALLAPVQVLHSPGTLAEAQSGHSVTPEVARHAQKLCDAAMFSDTSLESATTRVLSQELGSRLVKLTLILEPWQKLRHGDVSANDLMDVNLFEDATTPQVVFEEVELWLTQRSR